MARIRSVHPGLFTDEDFVTLSDAAKIFFIGLWTEADDQGVFEWKPATLRMKLMAGSTQSAVPLLDELEAAGRIKRYEVDGKRYAVVHNFSKFQSPKKPRAAHPLPDELRAFSGLSPASVPHPYPTSTEPVPHQSSTSTPPVPNQYPLDRDRDREKEKDRRKNLPPSSSTELVAARSPATTGPSPPGSGDDEDDGDFEDFWEAYPRRVNRGRTRAAWISARNTQPAEQLLAAAQRYAAENTGKPLRLVARPENWLHDQRWLDEPDHTTVNGASTNLAEPFAPGSPAHWRHRMRLWFDIEHGGPQRELWPRNWGPPPGDPDCQVPPDVLAEFR